MGTVPQAPDVSTPHVQGHSAYNRPASIAIRAASSVADINLALFAFFFTLRAFKLPPSPRLWWLAVAAFEAFVVVVLPKAFFGRSIGQMFWNLRSVQVGNSWLRRFDTFQCDHLTPQVWGVGIFLTVLAWGASLWQGYSAVWKHPLLLSAEVWRMESFVPPASGTSESGIQWFTAPFFYALGAWPKTFNDQPVFYQLPYEKGPPSRFVGRIIARWETPDITLTFEGPRTPDGGTGDSLPRETIRDCLINRRCLKVRDISLLRHIEAMERISPRDWSLQWFVVETPSFPEREKPQGIFLHASNPDRGQDRYVIITPHGMHQTLILGYPNDPKGEMARKLLRQAIGSLRVSEGLDFGRAWINDRLQNTRMDEIKSLADQKMKLEKLAEIQAHLVSKISVDPKTLDTYYHLGGTALMLKPLMQGAPSGLSSHWSALIRPLVQSTYRYAMDISPQDPRTDQLHDYWLDAQK